MKIFFAVCGGVFVAAVALILFVGWAITYHPDSREERIERCRQAAEKVGAEWYYTDAEGCIGEGVFGIHIPLDIDSPEFHR